MAEGEASTRKSSKHAKNDDKAAAGEGNDSSSKDSESESNSQRTKPSKPNRSKGSGAGNPIPRAVQNPPRGISADSPLSNSIALKGTIRRTIVSAEDQVNDALKVAVAVNLGKSLKNDVSANAYRLTEL